MIGTTAPLAVAAAAATAAARAVDLRQEVAALQARAEWRQLLADLGAAPGGPSVADLLQRAAAAAAAAAGQAEAQGSVGGVGSGGDAGSTSRLAEVVQQVAWEKLHTGDWYAVAVVWRDAYAAACILAAAAGLPGGSGRPAQGGIGAAAAEEAGAAAASSAAAEAAALGAALWHLDMAAIMGGALLRPAVDGLIEALQHRWQAVQRMAAEVEAAAAAGAQQQAQPERGGLEERGHGPPGAEEVEAGGSGALEGRRAKRPRLAAGSAEAADAALLPPGSLGPRGSPVAAADLPSLEAFWQSHMSAETPVVISGGWQAAAEGVISVGGGLAVVWRGRAAAMWAVWGWPAAVTGPSDRLSLLPQRAPARFLWLPARCLQAPWKAGLLCGAGQTPLTWLRWPGPAPCL